MKNSSRRSSRTLSMEQKRNIVNAARRRGDVKAVSRKTGFAMSTVSEVLSGKYNNTRIVNAAFDRARGRKNAKAVA